MIESVKGMTFNVEPVIIDGKIFYKCIFHGSKLIYTGGDMPSFDSCTFDNVEFAFRGGAGNTLSLMRVLYHAGFSETIDKTFDEIKNWIPDPAIVGNNKQEKSDG